MASDKTLYTSKSTLNSSIRYHLALPTNYRKLALCEQIDEVLIPACLQLAKNGTLSFLEIAVEKDCVRFIIEATPDYSAEDTIDAIKKGIEDDVVKKFPKVKDLLNGLEFWHEGYFIETMSSSNSGTPPLTFYQDQPPMTLDQTTYIFEVKLAHAKRIKRKIEIRCTDSLRDLAFAITHAYDFEFDQDYGFYDRPNWHKATQAFESFTDKGHRRGIVLNIPGVRHTKLTTLWQKVDTCWYFLFNYGTKWLFMVTLKEIGVKQKKTDYPRILEKKGEAPEQYPYDEQQL